MPSYAADASHRKYLILGAAVVAACVVLFFLTRHREDKVHTILSSELVTEAKEITVLLDEASSVCLDVARSTLELRRRESRQKDEKGRRIKDTGYLFPEGAREDLAFADGILELAASKARGAKRTQMRMAPGLRSDPVSMQLQNLYSMTRSLCHDAGGDHDSVSRYEHDVTTRLRVYKANLDSIDPKYVATAAERRTVLAQLQPTLDLRRRVARASEDEDDEASSWVPEERIAEPKSPEQVLAERKDLEAEEEWRRRQAEQQVALHRDAIDQWRDDGQATQRAMPSVGLREVDRDSLEGIQGEARTWSEIYRQETGAATVALRRFDMIRRIEVDERTTRACRALFSKVSDLLQSERLFSSPLDNLNQLLRQAYTAAKSSAEACLSGDMATANERFDRAETLFAKIETEYGISPD